MNKGTYNGYNYGSRPGTTYSNASISVIQFAKVIAYGDSTGIKHFAKVTSWDSSGNPLTVQSKWGFWEIVRSSSTNPFSYTYGTPQAYFS